MATEMPGGLLTSSTMNPWSDEAAERIRPAVQEDPTLFFWATDFEKNLSRDVGSALALKSLVAAPSATILGRLSGAAPSSDTGGGSCLDAGRVKVKARGQPQAPCPPWVAFEQTRSELWPQDREEEPAWLAKCG